MSNVLDVRLTYDNKSILCVVVVVIDHHVGNNNRFNLILAKQLIPIDAIYYFAKKLSQPSLANLVHSLPYEMIY